MYNSCPASQYTPIMPRMLRYALVEWPRLPAQVTGPRDRVVIVHEEGRLVEASAPLADWQAEMPLGRARNIYVQAAFVRRDRAREKAAHNALARHLGCFSLRMKAQGPGCFLLQDADIDGLAGFVAQHTELRAAAASCADWTRLAAYMASFATLRMVCNEAAFLAGTPVATLACGVLGENGAEVAERLQLFGLHDLDAVRRRLTRRHLCAQFGTRTGALLNGILRPGRQPVVPVYVPDREIDTAHELEVPSAAGKPWIRAAILLLAEHLARKLQGMAALTLALEAFALERGTVSTRYMAPRGLSSTTDLQRLACRLHESLCHRLGTREILSLRLAAGGLAPLAYAQGHFFTPRTEEPALRRAIVLLQKRYGQEALLRAERKDSLFPEKRLAFEPLT